MMVKRARKGTATAADMLRCWKLSMFRRLDEESKDEQKLTSRFEEKGRSGRNSIYEPRQDYRSSR